MSSKQFDFISGLLYQEYRDKSTLQEIETRRQQDAEIQGGADGCQSSEEAPEEDEGEEEEEPASPESPDCGVEAGAAPSQALSTPDHSGL